MHERRIKANGLEFSYIEEGSGPLVLCLHGFPETGGVFRHLMPALAAVGYRVVAPNLRGFAPTQVPTDGMSLENLIADANALHDALGGDGDSVIIGHDWGAFATWGAAAHSPDRWSQAVVLDIPPLAIYARKAADPGQIYKNSHFYFFQMAMADQIVAADDFAYLDWLWDHWSGSVPGFDSTQDRNAGKDSLRNPENLRSALALYRDNFDPQTFGTEKWEMGALLANLPSQPTLYLHGSEDPIVGEQDLIDIVNMLAPGSDGVLLPGVGHFPLIEQPDEVNKLILRFLEK
ncbi:alpha/beta fold hydrolase [Amycolatopsis sp. cmx-11-12]|uniref:alpha/beta fold hydrolase n=1 Tax=Amycolatopsis sp. cmx-11-12 TaxID=2785795 RepID=UPI0039185A00